MPFAGDEEQEIMWPVLRQTPELHEDAQRKEPQASAVRSSVKRGEQVRN